MSNIRCRMTWSGYQVIYLMSGPILLAASIVRSLSRCSYPNLKKDLQKFAPDELLCFSKDARDSFSLLQAVEHLVACVVEEEVGDQAVTVGGERVEDADIVGAVEVGVGLLGRGDPVDSGVVLVEGDPA